MWTSPLPLNGVPGKTHEILVTARWPVGGIRSHLGYNYPSLRESGYRITLVVPEDAEVSVLEESFPEATIIPVACQRKTCVLWPTLRSLMRSGRFGLVHAHGLTAAAHATIAKMGTSIPLVVTVHEPLREQLFSGWIGSLKRWLLGWVLSRTDAIISVSEDAQSNLLRHFPILRRYTKRLHCIPNGINTQPYGRTCTQERDLRTELSLDENVHLIGYLGRFMPEKGFPLLLEAICRLVRCGGIPSFHLAAFGTGDYEREYRKQIENQGLSNYITLLDFVPNVQPILEQLDLVVVPSLWEASSLISMEAMCAGVPVLGSDCLGLREVLRNTPSRMVGAGSVAALERGLREALLKPWFEEASRFATVARRRFDNRYSAQILLGLYEQLGTEMRQEPACALTSGC